MVLIIKSLVASLLGIFKQINCHLYSYMLYLKIYLTKGNAKYDEKNSLNYGNFNNFAFYFCVFILSY
ncbi:hypothetical protein SIR_0777 [Streptococcus intermedius B196]|uniref:Uncharacterized protein n=1 Tax=Streptococcus intermedius B196 TaxID=862967 RepID=T1ZE35_STRIT|nr:hypothetical protein SIR_0777 [Streptococcus intermedius B196]AGU77973.1 hypothetical protein SII_0791 [Streptococcus intermedius C270]